MASDIDKRVAGDFKIHIPSIGTGISRTSASWITFMLMAENCKSTQEQIIVEAMRQLGITPEDILAEWNDKACPECGMSLRSHIGGCP